MAVSSMSATLASIVLLLLAIAARTACASATMATSVRRAEAVARTVDLSVVSKNQNNLNQRVQAIPAERDCQDMRFEASVLRLARDLWREAPEFMTFREIIEREDQNTDSIWQYREGMFMKAYERSAFFAHTLIHEFKLSKRYIKTVNMDVISLGFPEQTIPKWLNGYVYEWEQDGLLRCHMRKVFDEVEFHNWKEVVRVNVGDRFTPHTAVIEKSPLYKVTYDLMTQVFDFSAHISKNVANPLGFRLKDLAYKRI